MKSEVGDSISLIQAHGVMIRQSQEKQEEYLVISSHLDHIWTHEGEINNGADDDGSGTGLYQEKEVCESGASFMISM